VKLIIFDIDGTLCHSRYIDDKCYIQAFKKGLGLDINNTDWNSYKHVTDHYVTKQIIIAETGNNPDKQLIDLIIDNYAEELKIQLNKEDTSFTAIPGVKELFEYFYDNSDEYQTGIATGGFFKTAMYKLDKIGIKFPEEHIYSSNNYDTKQEMINDLMDKEISKNNSFDKVIYVGDREYDFNVSKEINIDFIGIDFKGNGKLKSLGIEKVINNYEPIEKFLALI
jgi:phosphoglycolate phosphatase-like HAD superfamily hydrolase